MEIDTTEFIILMWLGAIIILALSCVTKAAGKALRDYLKDRLGGSG